MKNILIFCDSFPPAFAPRMGYLCKYLQIFGYNPTIISEYSPQNMYENLAEGQDVSYINFYFSKNKTWEKIKYTFVFLADFFFHYKNFIFIKKAKKIIGKKKIDIVLSSSYRAFPSLAAYKISQKYNLPFVMDLRDIIEQYPNSEYISKKLTGFSFINNFMVSVITKKLQKQRNKMLKNADAVTTVSGFHAIFLSKYNKNTHLIFNGFDPELFYPQTIETEQFTISYTGRIESQKIKDPSLFFEAIKNLLTEKKIDAEKLNIRFYLTDEKSKEIVKKSAQKYKIYTFINILNVVQTTEIPVILNESSILLLVTNKSTGENAPKGIMGTKTFEYLAVEKPILCVRNDEGCLEETIKNADAGISASTVEECEKFILEKYAEWQQKGFTHQPVNQAFIQQFSRKRQAEQFSELFNELLSLLAEPSGGSSPQ